MSLNYEETIEQSQEINSPLFEDIKSLDKLNTLEGYILIKTKDIINISTNNNNQKVIVLSN